ncbi:hypothetical protein GEMRC1_001395 [Eukaryota sp. GEM-RC1]
MTFPSDSPDTFNQNSSNDVSNLKSVLKNAFVENNVLKNKELEAGKLISDLENCLELSKAEVSQLQSSVSELELLKSQIQTEAKELESQLREELLSKKTSCYKNINSSLKSNISNQEVQNQNSSDQIEFLHKLNTDLELKINGLQEQNLTLSQNLEGLQSSVDDVFSTINTDFSDSLSDSPDTFNQNSSNDVSNLKSVLKNAFVENNVLKNKELEAAKLISDLENCLELSKAEVSQLQSSVYELELLKSQIQTEAKELESQLREELLSKKTKNVNSSLKSNISNQEVQIQNSSDQIEFLHKLNTDLELKINGLQEQNLTLSQNLEALQSSVDDVFSTINTDFSDSLSDAPDSFNQNSSNDVSNLKSVLKNAFVENNVLKNKELEASKLISDLENCLELSKADVSQLQSSLKNLNYNYEKNCYPKKDELLQSQNALSDLENINSSLKSNISNQEVQIQNSSDQIEFLHKLNSDLELKINGLQEQNLALSENLEAVQSSVDDVFSTINTDFSDSLSDSPDTFNQNSSNDVSNLKSVLKNAFVENNVLKNKELEASKLISDLENCLELSKADVSQLQSSVSELELLKSQIQTEAKELELQLREELLSKKTSCYKNINSSLKSNISNQEVQIQNSSDQIEFLHKLNSDLELKINGLQEQNLALSQNLEALQSSVDDVFSTINTDFSESLSDSPDTFNQNSSNDVSNLKSVLKNAFVENNVLKNKELEAGKLISDLENCLELLKADVSQLQSNVSELELLKSQIQTEAKELESQLREELLSKEDQLLQSQNALSDLENINSSLKSNISNQEVQIQNSSDQIEFLHKLNTDLELKINGLQERNLALSQNLESLQSSVDDVFSTINTDFSDFLSDSPDTFNQNSSNDVSNLKSVLKNAFVENNVLKNKELEAGKLISDLENCLELSKADVSQLQSNISELELLKSQIQLALTTVTSNYNDLQQQLPAIIQRYSAIISQNLSKTKLELMEVKASLSFYKYLSVDLETKLCHISDKYLDLTNAVSLRKGKEEDKCQEIDLESIKCISKLREQIKILNHKLTNYSVANSSLRYQYSNAVAELDFCRDSTASLLLSYHDFDCRTRDPSSCHDQSISCDSISDELNSLKFLNSFQILSISSLETSLMFHNDRYSSFILSKKQLIMKSNLCLS